MEIKAEQSQQELNTIYLKVSKGDYHLPVCGMELSSECNLKSTPSLNTVQKTNGN